MVRVCALGSGSKGNALLLTSDTVSLMVDGGFSRRELLHRLSEVGAAPETVNAVLLTHEHDDHVKGCRIFCDQLGIPLCTTSQTARYLRNREKLPSQVLEFEPGDTFNIGNFGVEPFSVQHDAVNPVGFVIRCDGFKIGIATDLGDLNTLAMERLSRCDALILESNYDERMLRDSDRSLTLKRRILGRHGHLDNKVALQALSGLLGANTRYLLLAHLSSECNDRALVQRLFSERLKELHREDVTLCLISQDAPAGPFELKRQESAAAI